MMDEWWLFEGRSMLLHSRRASFDGGERFERKSPHAAELQNARPGVRGVRVA